MLEGWELQAEFHELVDAGDIVVTDGGVTDEAGK